MRKPTKRPLSIPLPFAFALSIWISGIHSYETFGQPVTLTSTAQFQSANVEVLYSLDICDPEGFECETFEFRGFIDSFGQGETASPAFNALLAANPEVRTSVSYNASTFPNPIAANQFDATVAYRLRDPTTGEFVNSIAGSGGVALFDAGTNTTAQQDSLIGFGTAESGVTGFAEIVDPNAGEPEIFSFDPFNSFEESSGLSFEEILGPELADEIQANIFFDGYLPETYQSAFTSISFRDSEGGLLSSANDTFSLPIADLDKIDDGFAAISFAGDASFLSSDGTLPDGREVFVSANVVELVAFYESSTSIATTTPVSVLEEFDRTGEVPLQNIPGVFVLPDVISEPNDADPILINGDPFVLGNNFFFDETSMQSRVVFDPEVAIGYEYELTNIDEGAGFADIRVPRVGDDSEFQIAVFDPETNEYLAPVPLMAGDTLDYTTYDFEVTRFALLGIDTDEMVDPNDDQAFPALIGFIGEGTGQLRQTALVLEIPDGCVVPTEGILGDFDQNGAVEFADFLTLSSNFGTDVGSYGQGDTDCNGTVEFADFLTLSSNFGASVARMQPVPEPTSWIGILTAGFTSLLLRRKRTCLK